MVGFSIRWNMTDFKISNSKNGEYVSNKKLSNEWAVVGLWKGNAESALKPYSLEFRRVSTTYAVTVSGYFYQTNYAYIGTRVPNHGILNFSTFIESGISSKVILLDSTNSTFVYNNQEMQCKININSINILGDEEYKKYSHLVELSNDFGRLLEPETCFFTDVNIKCGEACIPAHKAILSARSPVFAAMFKNPMKENLENEVVIGDIDASVLQIMVAYIYKGTLAGLEVSSATDLLFAADKYQLGDLKKVCCEFFKDNLSLQNALRMVSLGELHYDDLKSSAIDYISNTCTDISALEVTEEWKTMEKERPDLAMHILTSIVKAKEKTAKLIQ